jgi:CHAD domain-containing protein
MAVREDGRLLTHFTKRRKTNRWVINVSRIRIAKETRQSLARCFPSPEAPRTNVRKVTIVANQTPPDESVPVLSSDDLVRQIMGIEVGNLLRFDPIAREAKDPEGVHQLRVSARRLRAELTVMYSVFHQEALDRLLVELRWLGKRLGRRRDFDVRVALFEHVRGEMPKWLAETLLKSLQQQKRDEDKRVRQLLDSDRYRHLLANLTEAVVRPPLNAHATAPATDVLGVGLCDALSAMVTKVEACGQRPTFEQLHEIRILAKRGRYSAALSAPLLGFHAQNIASSLEEVQTYLGELHDRVLVLSYLNQEFDDVLVAQPSVDLGSVRAGIERRLAREISRLDSQWRQPFAEACRHGANLCPP